MPVVVEGLVASLLAGLGTGLGALPVLFIKTISDRLQGMMLGFGGVMLAATTFSLLLPGQEAAVKQGYSETGAALAMALGLLAGGVFLWVAHNNFPHEHVFKGKEGPVRENLTRIWLFIIAITIHNFPEGLAVGVGFGGDSISNAQALAVGIGLQNIPEGLVVALALRAPRLLRSLRRGSVAADGASGAGRGACGGGGGEPGADPAALGHGVCCGGHAVCHQR